MGAGKNRTAKVVGIWADSRIVYLPFGVADFGAAAHDGVVSRLIKRVIVIGIGIEVDSGEGVA